ncbi:uncharacterized protein GGS22DRAFT_150664 [Annulohypoxylon maeteangense]|uniref:uncharacterized protein n=1 Tax=Annulohypoxylon maeteangense TaxID=1927788 RepID=UPI00200837BE|nr:uncharacterized protein GGS22DRAFT_150664 [Annulohypoxylon maeteangense]KAI0890350.1 hypothetical protein GGS22DRAFT_150664 [Annulohypoxylon maeteangense]
MKGTGVLVALNCGELVAELAAASAETPGSCAIDAVTEDVELGRDIGSRVAGNGAAAVPSSITDRIGGSAGDDVVRVGRGEVIGGRLLSTCNDATVEDAVVNKFQGPEKTRN